MNDIQKFYYDRMIAALYEAQAELMANIKSENNYEYFKGTTNEQLPNEIFNSFNELECFLNKSICNLESNILTQLLYLSLHANKHNGYSLFNCKSTTA